MIIRIRIIPKNANASTATSIDSGSSVTFRK